MPSGATGGKPARFGFRAKMLLYFGAGSAALFLTARLAMLFGIPMIGFKGEIEIHRTEVLQNLSAHADLKKSEIVHWFTERRNILTVITESNLFRKNVADVLRALEENRRRGLRGKDLLRAIGKEGNYRDLVQRSRLIRNIFGEFDSIRLADAKTGTIIMSTDEKDVDGSISSELSAMGVPGNEERIFFETEPENGGSHLCFSHPVRDVEDASGGGMILAVMIFRINHVNFLRPMLHAAEGLGRSGEVILVNSDRAILAPLKHPLGDGTRPKPMEYRLETKAAELSAWGIEGVVISADYRGVPVIAVVRHARITPDFGLGVIVKCDEREIFEPIRQSVIHSTAVSGAGMVVLLGFIYAISGKLSGPIERLSGTARKVEDGDLGARADVVNGDEVGALARSFNSMMERIQHWHEELDEAVRDRTSRLSEANRELESEIVERRRIERDLLHSKDYVENLLETANAMIVCLDTSGIITVFNRTAERVTGHARADLEGKNWFDTLVPRERYPYVREEFLRLLGGGIPKTFENPVLTKSGEERLISWQNNVTSEGGRVIGTVSFGIDITEQRKAEKDREKLEEQLRHIQKLEAVGTLAGGVAHDFNNILSAVIGYSHLALMKMRDDDPSRAFIEQILESSQRATALTQSLLAFGRKQAVTLAPVDLNGLIGKFEKFILRLIREDIELKTIRSDEPLTVMADAGQIEQVIMNLVTNARDAMTGGGRLTIETRRVRLDDVFVGTHGYGGTGEHALILVSDTGCGMDDKTRERIFEPFFTTKAPGKGTGLGLSTAFGIVKRHEGFINAYSEPGRGAIFKIYLPIARGAVAREEKAAGVQAPAEGGAETVLVAEDDPALLKLSASILGQSGYEVIEAVDGEDAVRKFIGNMDRTDLVILDGIMPGKNGKEAYEEMKRLRPDLKAIFISGYAEDVFTKDGILLKDVAFILKPVSPNDLLKKVREVLDT